MSDQPYDADRRPRVRFEVNPDGSVEVDEGASGAHLAAMLRYVCRMGSQIGALLGNGELERLSTLSSVAVMARVSGVSPHVRIKAEVETLQPSRPAPVATSDLDVNVAIKQSLLRVTMDLASDWTALITDERRLVGAVSYQSSGRDAPVELDEVGVRALAVLGALDEPLRETAVRFDYRRGSVLIAAIGDHALFTHADKFDDTEVVTTTINAVQGMLAGIELADVWGVTSARLI